MPFVNNNPTGKRNIVVLAEAPKKYSEKYPLDYAYSDVYPMPAEACAGVRQMQRDRTRLEDQIDDRILRYDGSDNETRHRELDSLHGLLNNKYEEFINQPWQETNYEEGHRAPMFLNELYKIQDYFKDSSDVAVHGFPIYGEEEFNAAIDSISRIGPIENISVLGHSANRMMGIKNEEIAPKLKKLNPKACFLGSCNTDPTAFVNAGLPVSAIYTSDSGDGLWHGFDRSGENYSDAFTKGNPAFKKVDPEENERLNGGRNARTQEFIRRVTQRTEQPQQEEVQPIAPVETGLINRHWPPQTNLRPTRGIRQTY